MAIHTENVRSPDDINTFFETRSWPADYVGFFANFTVGEDKSMVKVSFLGVLALCLRPAGGVKHSDSDLVETRMLSAKKALRGIEGSILSNSRKF